MKYLFILSFLFISCSNAEIVVSDTGTYDGEIHFDSGIVEPKTVIYHPERSTLLWKVNTNCYKAGGIPLLKFFDKESGETFGTYPLANKEFYITLDCIKNHKICWGAWMGAGDYYDCSDVGETGKCYYVKWNNEYRIWGCGPTCTKGVGSCPYCNSDAPLKNIFISCGDQYRD